MNELERAEAHLQEVLQRLQALRRAALDGDYDPVAFDRVVEAYRTAEAAVAQLRSRQPRRIVGVATAPALIWDAPTLRRLQFVRWLVATGRLGADDLAGMGPAVA